MSTIDGPMFTVELPLMLERGYSGKLTVFLALCNNTILYKLDILNGREWKTFLDVDNLEIAKSALTDLKEMTEKENVRVFNVRDLFVEIYNKRKRELKNETKKSSKAICKKAHRNNTNKTSKRKTRGYVKRKRKG